MFSLFDDRTIPAGLSKLERARRHLEERGIPWRGPGDYPVPWARDYRYRADEQGLALVRPDGSLDRLF